MHAMAIPTAFAKVTGVQQIKKNMFGSVSSLKYVFGCSKRSYLKKIICLI